jgi:DNA-binding NtrC family response regulator
MPREALHRLESHGADLLVTDLRMPGMSGVELLKRARGLHPDLSVILMTAFATVDSAVEAMKMGAFDHLQKPFSKDELLARVTRVADRAALVSENRRLRRELSSRFAPPIIGSGDAMRTLLHQVDRIAKTTGDVLVTGQSGTGKELVAHRLHAASERAAGPFVAVNCGAIPDNLAESELFGHEKGAFIHAVANRAGHFEQAVSASDVDLRARISDGEFREDLYHRLNVLELHIPPLRECRGGISELAAHFRDIAVARYDVLPPAPESTGPASGGAGPERLLDAGPISLFDVERRLLCEAIRRADGNLSEAAKQLGVSYKTFRYRVRKFGLDR